MTSARIELPPKLIPVFSGEARYRGSHGGRGSGKTRTFALMSAVFGYKWGASGVKGAILCGREFMNSLDDSSLEEIKSAIRSVSWLDDYYEIGEKYIRSKDGNIKYVFTGLRHNLDSIKGKSRLLLAWVDEAETVSEAAWRKLLPTVREENSEVWVTWNPESEDSATKKRFQDSPPENSKIVELNYKDNPWFPDVLEEERLNDLRLDPESYAHIWEGACITRTDAQVLAGKYKIEEFEPQKDWDGPYHGLDFGFANDPTAAVKCWINNGNLYIEREAGKIGLEIDDHVHFLNGEIPGIDKHVVRADCARPECISYMRRNGMPLTTGVKKGKGSVEDGITHLRSYNSIIVHPRCEEVARECRLYSYKTDRHSGDVLPVIADKDNHYMDALRYALEPLTGMGLEGYKTTNSQPAEEVDAWGRKKKGGASAWANV